MKAVAMQSMCEGRWGAVRGGAGQRRGLFRALLLAGMLCASVAQAEQLLTTNLLHPLATWTGGTGSAPGYLTPSNLVKLIDGDANTEWQSDGGTWQPSPTLTSPLPFIVTRVEVVASGSLPDRSAGAIEVMKVGSCGYTNTGLAVPATLTAGQTWSGDMPADFQVPLSAIRHNGGHWVNMKELRFYGRKVDRFVDVTKSGTTRTDPGTESPAGSLTDGLWTHNNDGYYTGGGAPHVIVTDFGAGTRQQVVYVAMNPNAWWKMPVRAVGTSGDYVLATVRASNLSGDTTDTVPTCPDPGHSWVVCAVNGGQPLSMGSAGIGLNNYWGCASEYVVLALSPPKGSVFSVR